MACAAAAAAQAEAAVGGGGGQTPTMQPGKQPWRRRRRRPRPPAPTPEPRRAAPRRRRRRRRRRGTRAPGTPRGRPRPARVGARLGGRRRSRLQPGLPPPPLQPPPGPRPEAAPEAAASRQVSSPERLQGCGGAAGAAGRRESGPPLLPREGDARIRLSPGEAGLGVTRGRVAGGPREVGAHARWGGSRTPALARGAAGNQKRPRVPGRAVPAPAAAPFLPGLGGCGKKGERETWRPPGGVREATRSVCPSSSPGTQFHHRVGISSVIVMGLERSGTVVAYCSVDLLASSSPSTTASQEAGDTDLNRIKTNELSQLQQMKIHW
nr:translation initiation factor IF-2-like [Pongo pygmaeus]